MRCLKTGNKKPLLLRKDLAPRGVPYEQEGKPTRVKDGRSLEGELRGGGPSRP